MLALWITDALGGPGGGFNLSRKVGRNKTNMNYLGIKTRAPCVRCNNEWMSQLEQKVKPLITPIIRNEDTRWDDPADQKTVATWIYKTALMIDRSGIPDSHTVPLSAFRYLHEHREPPPSATIALGHYVPLAREGAPFSAWMGTSWTSGENASGATEHGYRVTFSVGHAIFQTHGHSDVEREGLIYERTLTLNGVLLTDFFRRLWPLVGAPHEWPPRGANFSTSFLPLLEDKIGE